MGVEDISVLSLSLRVLTSGGVTVTRSLPSCSSTIISALIKIFSVTPGRAINTSGGLISLKVTPKGGDRISLDSVTRLLNNTPEVASHRSDFGVVRT
jgi:hypothetical protein